MTLGICLIVVLVVGWEQYAHRRLSEDSGVNCAIGTPEKTWKNRTPGFGNV